MFPATTAVRKGTSTLDVRQRLVVSAVWQPIFIRSDEVAGAVPGEQLAARGARVRQFVAARDPDGSDLHGPAPAGFTAANNGTLNGYTSSGFGGRVPFLPINSLDIGHSRRSMPASPSSSRSASGSGRCSPSTRSTFSTIATSPR